MWENRNQIEHKDDKEKEINSVDTEISEEIEKGTTNLPADDYMFSEQELQKLQDANLTYKKSWLQNVRVARQRAAKRALSDQQLTGMRNLMRNYLSIDD